MLEANLHETVRLALLHDGLPIQFTGDGYLCLFKGLQSALDMGHRLIQALQAVPDVESRLAVRVAVHASPDLDPRQLKGTSYEEAERAATDGPEAVRRVFENIRGVFYFGRGYLPIAYASRLLGITRADQVLVSEDANRSGGIDPVRSPFHEHVAQHLKDFDDRPQPVFEYLYDGESKGAPGAPYLPGWYRGDVDAYVPRPQLEQTIVTRLKAGRSSERPTPIVCLWGEGGMGKTRLAIRTATRVSGLYPDATFFLNLGEISLPEEVARQMTKGPRERRLDDATERAMAAQLRNALADALKLWDRIEEKMSALRDFWTVEEAAQRAFEEAFEDLTRTRKKCLLILDNYESMAVSRVNELLAWLVGRSRDWLYLVTSRENLALATGKQSIELNDGLEEEEAKALFIERWNENGPAEIPDSALIAETIQECDRIPLAIELFALARRIHRRPLFELLEGLRKERAKHLDAGRLTKNDDQENRLRHHSVEATLWYSYNLLTETQKRDLRACGAFRGSWSRDAMDAVLGLEKTDGRVGELVDRSRVFEDPLTGRYRMHRSALEFARERLAEISEEKRTVETHFDIFFASLVAEEGSRYGKSDGSESSNRLLQDEANWLATLRRTRAESTISKATMLQDIQLLLKQRPVTGLEILESVDLSDSKDGAFIMLRLIQAELLAKAGRTTEARTIGEELAGFFLSTNETLGQAKALLLLGGLYIDQGDTAKAWNAWTKAEILYIKLDDLGGRASTLYFLGGVHRREGRNEQALVCWAKAEELCREVDDQLGLGNIMRSRGDIYYSTGNNADAMQAWAQAISLYEKCGLLRSQAAVLESMGHLLSSQNRYSEALTVWGEAEQLCILGELPVGRIDILMYRGDLYSRVGRNDEAFAEWDEAERLSISVGNPVSRANVLHRRGTLLFELGRSQDALVDWLEAERIFAEASNLKGRAHILFSRGRLLAQQGQGAEALATWSEAHRLYTETNDVLGQANVFFAQGEFYAREKRNADALHVWKNAEQLYRRIEGFLFLAKTLRGLGEMFALEGQNQDAIAAWAEAGYWYAQIGDPVGRIDMLFNQGLLFFGEGRDAEALMLWSEVERFCTESNLPLGRAKVLQNCGSLYTRQRRTPEALAAYEEAERLYAAHGQPEGQANVLRMRGDLYAQENRNEEACAAWDEAGRLMGVADMPLEGAHILLGYGSLRSREGRYAEAEAAWAEAERLYREANNRLGVANVLHGRGDQYAREGQKSNALLAWDEAAQIYVVEKNLQGQANVLRSQGFHARSEGHGEQASALWSAALPIYSSLSAPIMVAELHALIWSVLPAFHPEKAIHLTEAQRLLKEIGQENRTSWYIVDGIKAGRRARRRWFWERLWKRRSK